MAFNVVAIDEGWVNGVGFLDLQPVKTIEAFLLEAGRLTYPTNMWPLKSKFPWKENHKREFLSPLHTGMFLKYVLLIVVVPIIMIYCIS